MNGKGTDSGRSDRDTIFTGPKCLIEAEDGTFTVNKETLRQISTVTKKLVIVAIVGLYRTGKSYLLTRLAGKYSGFPLGNAIQSKTKGIWAWCVDHPVNEDEQLLLLDTEGLGDIEKGDATHDNKIFTMATLLSSTLVYNCKGAFDQDALMKLSFVVNLAKNVKVADEDSDEEGGQLDIYLPDFVLALRDFFLEMELDGKEVSPDKYLDHCLRVKQGGEENIIFNEPRLRLRRFFKNRKCFTMASPGNRKVLKELETLTDKDLDPDFVEDVQKFLDYVYHNAKPFRTRNETPINGSMFVTLVETYMDAFNKGAVPCIDKAFKVMALKENERAIDMIFDDYKKKMQDLKLPTKDELDLSNAHRNAKEIADEKYLQMVIMDDCLEFKEKLSIHIRDHFKQLRDENKKLSSENCMAKLKELYDPISKKVKSGKYLVEGGYEAYQSALNIAKENYYSSESIGFMRDTVFIQFIERCEAEKKEVLEADMQLQEAEKRRKLEEDAKRIAAEKERIRKLEQENLGKERLRIKELEKQEFENMRRKLEEDMRKEKEKTEEVLKKKQEECKRLEEEGLRKDAEREQTSRELMKRLQEERENTWGSWFYKNTIGRFW